MLDVGTLHDEVASLTDQLVADRRHFHAHPELGFEEHETAAYVADRLRSLGIEPRTGIAGTGVVGLISGPVEGRCVLLRADMDALPLVEETGAPYASQRHGVHHACGHDGHTAILLAVAEVLMRHRDELRGTVKLLFQPAEEGPGGAQPMIAAGVLENPHVDAAFGLHLSNDDAVGKIIVQEGPVQASSDEVYIHIEGNGGHGGYPHQTVDAVTIGAAIVNELQRIVSREVDPLEPAVVSIGVFNAGYRHNIIAPRAELAGTIRTLDEKTRAFVAQRVREVATSIATAHRATCEVEIRHGYPVTANDPAMTEFVRSIARQVVPPEQVEGSRPIMGAEDMSYFLLAVPGCFAYVGSGAPERNLAAPHHSPYFDFDEACLPIGAELLSRVAIEFLRRD